MKNMPAAIEEILTRINDDSRRELDMVRRLADAVRRADEQTLREMRAVTVQHEMRREALLGEMQTLASRLFALPQRHPDRQPAAALPDAAQNRPEQISDRSVERALASHPTALASAAEINGGGYWRHAAQKIDDVLESTFNGAGRAH